MLDAWLPKSAPFFEYLLHQNKIMCSLCDLIPRPIGEEHAMEAEMNREATRLEEEGDEVYATLIKNLSQTFITPIDREDILRISKEHENTIDLLQNLVTRLYVFNMNYWPDSLQKIAQNLSAMSKLTTQMLEGLTHRKDTSCMQEFRTLRNICEELLSSGLGEALAVSDITPDTMMLTLKQTRAYDRMEQAVMQLVELAEAIEEAVMKNA